MTRLFRFSLLVLTAGCLLLLDSCQSRSGNESAATEDSLRIISLLPSVTDQLYDLAVADRLVGCTSYCSEAIADGVPVVGSVIQPSTEQILAQHPSLIFVPHYLSPEFLSLLSEAGVETVVIDNPSSFEDICADYRLIADKVGARARADEQLALWQEEVARLRHRGEGRSIHPRVFMQIAFSPLFGANGTTYMHDLIAFSGGVNVAAALPDGPLSLEYILQQDPECLILIESKDDPEPSRSEWEKLSTVTAIQRGNIFSLEPDIVSQPTPAHFLLSLRQMVDYLDQVH